MAKTQQPEADSLLDSAVQLIASEGWESFRLSELAKRSGVALADVYAAFPDRGDILVKLIGRLHARAAEMTPVDASASSKDRLFDAIMQVFDAAAEDKPVLRVLVRDLPRDPATLVVLWTPIEKLLSGVLDRAGMPLSGIWAPFRMLGLTGIATRALTAWVDDGPELAKTMATLDSDLRRVEPLLERVSPTPKPKPEAEPPAPEAPRDTVH